MRCSPPGRRYRQAHEERAVDEAEHARRALSTIDDPWLHVRFEADARRTGTAAAPVRRRRRPPRPSGRDLAAARVPADRGVPGRQPRTRPMPGRRLRARRRHAPSSRSTRPKPPVTCEWRPSPGCTSVACYAGRRGVGCGANRSRARHGVASDGWGWRAGRARRVLAGGDGRSRRDRGRSRTSRCDPRCRPPRGQCVRGGLRPRRPRPHRRRSRRHRRRRAMSEVADARMQAASHFIAEPDRVDAVRRPTS